MKGNKKGNMSEIFDEQGAYSHAELGENLRETVAEYLEPKRQHLRLVTEQPLEIVTTDVSGNDFVAPLEQFELSSTDEEGLQAPAGHLFARIIEKATDNKGKLITAATIVSAGAALTALTIGIRHKRKGS